MKKRWKYKKIKDVGEVIGGTTPSTTNPEFWGGDICWISPAELHGEHYLYDSIKKITAKAVSAKSLKELPVGTVILSSRAPIGKIAINKVPMYCNQGFKCVVCGPELYNEFLYWWLYGKVDYLNSLGTGATFKEISKTVVENIVVPIPPLDEQQRIVSRLDAAFAHIDELKANAEKQLSEARALFQKALTKAMEPKEGWEEKKIREICLIKGGKRVPQGYKLETEKTDYPYIRVADFTDEGTISLSDIHYINSSVFQQIKNYTITDKDIYISIAGTIGKSGIIPSCLNGANLTENACKLVLNNGINQRYVYWFTKSDVFKGQISLATRQTSQPKLALTRLAEVCISLPSLSEQQRIVSRLDSLSAHVRELEEVTQKTIAECDALKQALLRQVFE